MGRYHDLSQPACLEGSHSPNMLPQSGMNLARAALLSALLPPIAAIDSGRFRTAIHQEAIMADTVSDFLLRRLSEWNVNRIIVEN